ncbi:MAG: FprA family A-type flavoprotein [Bacteroidaceae bacterium]|nr:FprA family A-type flavoprotein [Bacteroidaceae bacterium]
MTYNVTEKIVYIGVNDTDIDLFESQYAVPHGISYNSYLILDEKVAIMDTVDLRKGEEWWGNLTRALAGRKPDYLVVQHMEPDHAGNLAQVLREYPELKVVASGLAIRMLPQFFENTDFKGRTLIVKDGDSLTLGKHTLLFFMAPMVHWPEVMVTYDLTDKVMFTADGFGKFGALTYEEEWVDEARRYYFNICGKYGAQVQLLLKKMATLDIAHICPLHGPILSDNLEYYIGLYDIWSSYKAEVDGVLIAYASIYGGTTEAANRMAELLRKRGVYEVVLADLSRDDMSGTIANAFRMSKLIVAASSYDADLFPPMHDFLYHLKLKAYQGRRVGIIENGSWAPCAAKVMVSMLEQMKEVEIVHPVVTIRSRLRQNDMLVMETLAEAMMAKCGYK